MKQKSTTLIILLVLAVMTGAALADPGVPNVTAGLGNTCSGISVSTLLVGNTFTYSVTVNPGATFNGKTILSVRDLVVYPYGGGPGVGPSSIDAVGGSNWAPGPEGYNASNNGFEFGAVNQPLVNGVLPNGIAKAVGKATFASLTGLDQFYLVHAIYQDGTSTNTGYCSPNGEPPPVIPEPGTMGLLALGLLPMAGILKRKLR